MPVGLLRDLSQVPIVFPISSFGELVCCFRAFLVEDRPYVILPTSNEQQNDFATNQTRPSMWSYFFNLQKDKRLDLITLSLEHISDNIIQ